MREPLMTIDEAAEYIGRSPDTLRKWRAERHGPPAAKIGRRLAYRRSEIDAWIDAQFEAAVR